jgi:hypothetical protein
MVRVVPAVPLGDKHLDRLIRGLIGWVAKSPLSLGVERHDLAGAVDQNHRGRRRLQKQPQSLGRSNALRDVPNHGDHKLLIVQLDRRQPDFYGDLAAGLMLSQ